MISPSIIINNSKTCDRMVFTDATIYGDPGEDIDIDLLSTSLEIKAPGSCCFVTIPLPSRWCNTVITAGDLAISCYSGIGGCAMDLPDGIYEIKYRVEDQEASYYHLQVCQLWNKYLTKSCELFDSQCGKNPKKYQELLNKMYDIRNNILDAVILAEDCLDVDRAMVLYNNAEEKLNGNGCMC